jgi:hypothetical protein
MACAYITSAGDSVMYSIVIIKNHYTAGHYEGDVFVNGTLLAFRLFVYNPLQSAVFTIVCCRGAGTTDSFIEPLKTAFREQRCTLREFKYEENRPGGLDGQIAEAKQQVTLDDD